VSLPAEQCETWFSDEQEPMNVPVMLEFSAENDPPAIVTIRKSGELSRSL